MGEQTEEKGCKGVKVPPAPMGQVQVIFHLITQSTLWGAVLFLACYRQRTKFRQVPKATPCFLVGWGIQLMSGFLKTLGICRSATSNPLRQLRSFLQLVCAKSLQPCPTLWDLMDCGLPDFSVHRIFQARILKCAAVSYFRGSSNTGIESVSLTSLALASGFFCKLCLIKYHLF